MNQWKYLFGLLFLFLLACSRVGEHEALFRQVESVMNKRPDSAMVLLETIQNPERLPEKDWAYWALLTTQAKDKLYIRHTSDSVINRVVDYFDGFSFFRYRHEKALAYFYKGRVHEDLGDVKKALEAYLKAVDFVRGTGDYKLTYLIESYLGDIYVHQGANDLALKYFNKAKEAAERSKDSLNIAYTLVYLARGHGKQENWTQASDFYKQAIKIARQSQNIDVVLIGMQELASVYARQDSLISALNLMKRTVELEIKYDITHDFSTDLVIGNIYRKLCQVDSALFYLEKALGSENIYTRRSTYQALYYLYIEADSLSKAIKYNELVNASADSIAKMGNASDLYQVKEAHEAVNRQAVDMRRWLSAGAVVLALLFALGYSFYRYRTNRRRLERQIFYLRQMEERLKGELKEGINQDQDFRRKRNQEIIDRLTHDLAAVQKQLEQETARWRTKYAKAQELAKSYKKELRQYADGPFAERRPFEEVLDQLRKEPRVLGEQERQELRLFMDAQNNSFTVRLLEANPDLKAGDLLLCCLIRLGFSGKSLATLLAINLNSVTKQKQRLRGRLVQKPANDAELTDYIRNF